MSPRFIYETGIRPWQEIELPSNDRFATVSIIGSSPLDLLPIINKAILALGGRYTRWFRWHTTGYVFEGNAMQKRKLAETLGLDIGCFRNPIVRMNDQVISSIASVILPITAAELDTLSDYRRELLIGAADAALTPEALSILMAPYSEGCDGVSLAGLLALRNEMVFGQCFEDSDTHVTFQWFGPKSDLRSLSETLSDLGVRALASRGEVAFLLRE